MAAQQRRRSTPVVLLAALSGLTAGCFGGAANQGFSWHLAPGDATRLEVRPQENSVPVGKQLLLIATVYDEKDNPRSKRRVEWLLEGPGNIIEVDESAYLPSRSHKQDNKYAVTYTDRFEHSLPKGVDSPLGQVIRPGQTWCVISSAVEGQTIVTAYAPDIADPVRNRVLIKAHWVDARWQFPQPTSAKAGSDQVLTTQINRHTSSDAVSNYRVRYTILDDAPAAAVYLVSAQKNGTPRSVTVNTDADGFARVNVAELKPEFGSNHISIEIMRPDPSDPSRFVVVAKSETRIDWQAPQVKLSIDAPGTALVKQAFPITFSVLSGGAVDTTPMVFRTTIPDGCTVVSTDPKATQDGNDLLWSLPALPGGKQHTIQAIFLPAKTGKLTTTASVRTNDNLRDDKTAAVQVNEGKLDISLSGPQSGLVGENLAFQITVKNPGTGPATNVKVTAEFDASLEITGRSGGFSTTIDKLEAGQSQSIALPLVAKQAGRSAVKASVTADGGLQAETPATAVDVKKSDLNVSVYGPPRGYLNQEATWTVRVFNPSDLPLADVKVRAQLPPQITFKKASNDGKYVGGAVEWNIGTSIGKQWTDLTITGVCNALTTQAVVAATVGGTPLDKRGGDFKPVSLIKPVAANQKAEASIEILGVPSLQLEVTDSADPVQVGQKLTYTIRVKNAGSLTASKVEVSATLPPQLKPVKLNGATAGKIDGQKVTFPAVAGIQPNVESVFTIEADAVTEGDGRFQAEVMSLALTNPIRSEEPTRVLGKNVIAKSGP